MRSVSALSMAGTAQMNSILVPSKLNNRDWKRSNHGEQHSHIVMKTLLYLIAVIGMLGIATPSYAGRPYVNQRRIVNFLPGGVPVYAVYQIVGYNSRGFPIYQWVTQRGRPVYARPGHGYTYGQPHHRGHAHRGHVHHSPVRHWHR